MTDTRNNIGLVIPTLNAGPRWAECLRRIRIQSVQPRRLLNIDSSSSDDTPDLSRAAGFEVKTIRRSEFNHGGTRQWAADYLSDCDLIVFLTQDALLSSIIDIHEITSCFADPDVAMSYGRQLPHVGATAIEAHARIFNYGGLSAKKDATSVRELGTKAFFCSNSFAAYRRSVLVELGGFARNLILGEDMEFAARAIKAGYGNFYCATAAAYHSHNYSIAEIGARYFDIGVFDSRNSWMRKEFGSHSGEGLRFVASELRYLASKHPIEIPRAIAQTFTKYLGYRLGRLESWIPVHMKLRLSMQPSYWR